jgi:hypothetical protein
MILNLYLRDLSPNMRAETERAIRQKRPDLAKILDNNLSNDWEQDIAIGCYVNIHEYAAC